MPKAKVDNSRKTAAKTKRGSFPQSGVANSDSVHSDEELDDIPRSTNGSDSEKNILDVDGDVEYTQDFGGEMSKLLERFSSDLNKTMNAKRRKLEQFTQDSTRATTKKVLETNKNQSSERAKIIQQFQNQFFAMIEQGEAELEKIKEAEEKLQKLLVQQHKHQQQVRIAHSQRLKSLKNLSEEFCKGMDELERNHVHQYSSVHNELKKEMAMLQKKILMETQEQQMMNVRKHLKQLFA